MTCAYCGFSNVEAARFCSSCGVEFSDLLTSIRSTVDEEITQPPVHDGNQQSAIGNVECDPLLGSSFGARYRIDSKLGSGGMGAVYRATRLVIGDEVAVKILHSEQSDPHAAERFRREAQAAARLKHPNAVTIHDFGVSENGLQYLVMELVEGDSLRQIIKHRGPITPSAAGEIIHQVCGALDEAHRHSVIHRDIKPDNIIVHAAQSGLRVKVLDFGIAKLRDDAAGNLTQTGSILGTPHYMSPEQCLGEELDHRSDIYSLGVVVYEMLTGFVPFNSPASAAVVVQQVTQPPPALRSLNTSISPAVERVVLHALEKQRDARPKTAGEFSGDFSRALVGKLTSAPLFGKEAQLGQSSSDNFSLTQPTVVVSKPSDGRFFGNSEASASKAAPRARNTFFSYIAVGLAALILGGILVAFLKSGQKPGSSNLPPTQPTSSPTISDSNKRPGKAADPAEQVPPLTETEVRQLLESWRRAWETKDLYAYANYYDQNFIGRNYSSKRGYVSMTRSQWLHDKEQKFRRNPVLSVTIGNPTLGNQNNLVSVVFPQEFRSSGYSDKGVKTLYLRRGPTGEIKIVREDFMPDGGAR